MGVEVVNFPYGATLRDAPAKLRLLADNIERGDYGVVSCVGVVLLGDTMNVFGYGDGIKDDGIAPSVATLFAAAQLRLIKELERHGS